MHPTAVAPTFDGGFLIADSQNYRVRRVSRMGTITTVAGNGNPPDPNADAGPAPDDGLSATSAALQPGAVAALRGGGFLVADNLSDRVRHVSPQGVISTVAGTGREASDGDGGPAGQASLFGPRGLAVRADGGVLVAEFGPGDRLAPGGDRLRFVGDAPFAPVASPPPAFKSDCAYRPPELALRLWRRVKARHGRPFRIRLRLSERATVRVRIHRGPRRVLGATRRARRGLNSIPVRRRLRPGRYLVRLEARTRDGRLARARARLTVRRRAKVSTSAGERAD